MKRRTCGRCPFYRLGYCGIYAKRVSPHQLVCKYGDKRIVRDTAARNMYKYRHGGKRNYADIKRRT